MENDKVVYVDGLRFCRDDRTGYYLNRKHQIRLHRYIWERVYGPIPPGYDIHHKDFNKANNELNNLAMLTEAEHHRVHEEALTEEQKQSRKERFRKNVSEAAKRWHKSSDGREWHKIHAQDSILLSFEKRDLVCQNCGKVYQGTSHTKFCSNACKSAWRRTSGIDDITVTCHACGKEFKKNKNFVNHSRKRNKLLFCSHSCASRYLIAEGIMPCGCHGRRKRPHLLMVQDRLAL